MIFFRKQVLDFAILVGVATAAGTTPARAAGTGDDAPSPIHPCKGAKFAGVHASACLGCWLDLPDTLKRELQRCKKRCFPWQSHLYRRASLIQSTKQLWQLYIDGSGSPQTQLVYHHRLDGPRGIAALSSPEDIAAGIVRGQPLPYGYGSGIQDVALENGQLLFALCEAQEATGDPQLADWARSIFAGLRLAATVSPEPGFVPRGPHPDGKSYYRDSACASDGPDHVGSRRTLSGGRKFQPNRGARAIAGGMGGETKRRLAPNGSSRVSRQE